MGRPGLVLGLRAAPLDDGSPDPLPLPLDDGAWGFTLGGWPAVVPAGFVMPDAVLCGIKARSESTARSGA